MNRYPAGFTLIELMIVVVVVGVLAAIAVPRFAQVSAGAKQAEAEPILKQICALAAAERERDASGPATILEIPGWDDPVARYFEAWSFTPATPPALGTASASPKASQPELRDPSLDCTTGELTLS